MPIADFLNHTPRSFDAAARGYRKKEQQSLQVHWEVMRCSTVALLNIQLPRGKKIIDPKHWMKFPWDKKESNANKISREEAAAIVARWK